MNQIAPCRLLSMEKVLVLASVLQFPMRLAGICSLPIPWCREAAACREASTQAGGSCECCWHQLGGTCMPTASSTGHLVLMWRLAPATSARQVVADHPVPRLSEGSLGEVGVGPGVHAPPRASPATPVGAPLILVPQGLGRLQVHLRQGLLLQPCTGAGSL